MAAGDAAHDVFDHETALKNYKAAFNADAKNCEAAWKVSRALANIGDERTDKAERTDYFNKAEAFAKTAIELCPDSDMAHLSMSIAVGRVALMAGKKEQVQLSQVVKDEAEKAIQLNPNNDTAHHVYARWHRKVATLSGVSKTFAKILYGGLPDASLDKAVEHFQKAIALKPDYNNHYLELGITYEMMNEWVKANDAYKKAMAVEAKGSMEKKYKAEAAERQKLVAEKI
jgi:tetratricopeptide (TPR) repeat protein